MAIDDRDLRLSPRPAGRRDRPVRSGSDATTTPNRTSQRTHMPVRAVITSAQPNGYPASRECRALLDLACNLSVPGLLPLLTPRLRPRIDAPFSAVTAIHLRACMTM
jgi:hypothetical protein